MLNKLETLIKKIAKGFNEISSWAIVVAMLLVVANIILRIFFKNPLLGTYEYTGFIATIIVGFGLAHCLLVDAHIFIDFMTSKFKTTSQAIINTITSIISFCVMSVFTVFFFKYGFQLASSNSVSPTTQFPFYIFVYLVGICFTVLCLSILVKIKSYVEDVKSNES